MADLPAPSAPPVRDEQLQMRGVRPITDVALPLVPRDALDGEGDQRMKHAVELRGDGLPVKHRLHGGRGLRGRVRRQRRERLLDVAPPLAAEGDGGQPRIERHDREGPAGQPCLALLRMQLDRQPMAAGTCDGLLQSRAGRPSRQTIHG